MTKNARTDNTGTGAKNGATNSTDRERQWIERGGAIAKGDPKAPPPKAPAGGSGTFRPKGAGGK
jgi:hypothetical protein